MWRHWFLFCCCWKVCCCCCWIFVRDFTWVGTILWPLSLSSICESQRWTGEHKHTGVTSLIYTFFKSWTIYIVVRSFYIVVGENNSGVISRWNFWKTFFGLYLAIVKGPIMFRAVWILFWNYCSGNTVKISLWKSSEHDASSCPQTVASALCQWPTTFQTLVSAT